MQTADWARGEDDLGRAEAGALQGSGRAWRTEAKLEESGVPVSEAAVPLDDYAQGAWPTRSQAGQGRAEAGSLTRQEASYLAQETALRGRSYRDGLHLVKVTQPG